LFQVSELENNTFNTFAAGSFSLNEQFARCLSSCITCQVIVIESCSNPQRTHQVLKSAMKKNFLVLGFRFFVSDVTSRVVLSFFGLLRVALGPNH